MIGDRFIRPCVGTAAGVPYVALPPTAVDADPDGPVRIVAAWHGFDPPRTERAFSGAVSMTGLPAWRVYLRLPMPVGWPPPGRDDRAACGVAAGQAAAVLPAALDEIQADLRVDPGPIGLVGVSAGALAVLLTLADQELPVAAAALIAPIVAPAPAPGQDPAIEPAREQPAGHPDDLLERLDISARVADIARNDTALMLVSGVEDKLVTAGDLTRFRDLLREGGMREVEVATFRMGHELAAEPGTEAEPPTAAAVSVDAALTDWFRARLGTRPRRLPRPGDATPAQHSRERAEAVVSG